jgi:N-acetylglucosamine kinase-like BadF-type ATPase
VAGTGSIAWGRTREGQEARAGGWGYLLGDEGSGYAIALESLRALARRADEGGSSTALGDCLLERLGLREVREIVPLLYGGKLDRPALAGLAPVVIERAASDPLAREIVQQQARELARTACVAVNRLGFGSSSFPLALAGGLLVSCERYHQIVLEELRAVVQPAPVTMVREPAQGAVNLAQGKRGLNDSAKANGERVPR